MTVQVDSSRDTNIEKTRQFEAPCRRRQWGLLRRFAAVSVCFWTGLEFAFNCTTERLNVQLHATTSVSSNSSWNLSLWIYAYGCRMKVLVRRWLCLSSVSPPLCLSAREGRHVWGDRRPSLLQQEQDWGKISNSQMFLFPGTSGRHHPGHALVCGRCVSKHLLFSHLFIFFAWWLR